jgi:hypothetical protein
MVMSSTTASAATAPLQQPPRGGDSNASTIARSDAKTPDPSTKANTDPPQGSSSQKVAIKPSASGEVGPGPQQATGIRVSGSTALQGEAEIWAGRNARGLYAYLVTQTISVPLGRITEQSLAQAKQGLTPINRSEDFFSQAKALMADPGISGRDYPAGNVEIVADQPATQAELLANYGAGRVPSFNSRVHDVMRQTGLAPDPRDGRTYTLPATRLGGQIAAGIFFDQPEGQAGVLDGLADANKLFPGAPKAFTDGFNGSKLGFYAMRTVSGIQTGVSLLAVAGGARVWSGKVQNLPVRLNTTLRIPGAGTVARVTSAVMNRVSPSPRTTSPQSKPVTPEAPARTEAETTGPVRPATTLNNSLPKPSGGNRTGGGLPGNAKAAQSTYFDRNSGGLGNGQTPSSGNVFSTDTSSNSTVSSAMQGFDRYAQGVIKQSQQTQKLIADALQRQQAQNTTPQSAYPNTQAPTPQAPVIKPGEPARIGGVSAKIVGDGGNLQATYEQATAQTRNYNNVRGTDVSLVYPVKDQGVQRLHVIQGISPSEARTLMYQLDQRGQLALPRKDVFFHNGIGGRRSDGSVVTPEQDLQQREADVFFSKLTSQQITAKVQANTLTVNGKQGVALNASQWGEASRLYTQANAPQRGMVSLALQRQRTLQGPHGQTRQVPVMEAWADLTPEEARALVNRAAGFNAKGEQKFTPTLINPEGDPSKDASGPTLKANGLSPEGLSQRSKVLYQQQHPVTTASQAQPSQTQPKAPASTSNASTKGSSTVPDPYDRLSQEGVRVTFTPYDRDLLKTSTSNAAVYRPGETQPPEGTSSQSTAPIDYSRFGRTAVIGDFPDGSDPVSKGTAALLASNLNGATPLVVVGDKYTPNIIGDMAPQGNNRTVFAKSLERYQDVRTAFYARPTNFADPDSVRDFVRFAYQLPAGANVTVATNEGQSFATFGHKLRPDVNWSGNSSYATFLGGRSADSTAQLAVSAVTDASALANGREGGNLARPLPADDARFLSDALGVSVPDGLVISAPFDGRGNLERSSFMRQYSRDPGAARASLLHATADWNDGQSRVRGFAIGNRPELAGTTFPQLIANPTQLANLLGINPPSARINQVLPVTQSPSPDYSVLGKTAVLGATSKAGGAALAQLADKVPLVGVSRSNIQAEMPRGVTWSNRVPSDVKTVVVTAAVPWRTDPVTKAIIFDRKVLVQDNINVVLPYLDSIPRGATVNVVTNPSNTIAWVVQALRPDLKVLGHEGTDVGRLDARNRDGLLFGLHSPFLVATDRNGNPDPVVPVAGNIYARGGYSATNTTGTWAVTETVRARQGIPGNYAVALKPDDAAWLTQLARTHITGWDREIPTGMVVTAPINPANGTLLRAQIESLFQKFAADERAGITYTALRPIPKSPNFNRVQLRPTQLLSQALQELFNERGYALEALHNIVSEKHPELRQVPIEQLLADPANLLRLLQ